MHSKLTKEDRFFIQKVEGLYKKACSRQIPIYTPFVSPQVLEHLRFDACRGLAAEMLRINPFAERVLFGFIPEGEEAEWPVAALEVMGIEFGKISHRDVLGSLMGLGIKREVIGDIFVDEQGVFIVAVEQMIPFLKENLFSIGRHAVTLEEVEIERVARLEPDGEIRTLTAASLRADLIISKAFGLSRSKAQGLFVQDKVKCNHLILSQHSKELKAGDLLSVRGYGRLRILEQKGTTRKGNLLIEVRIFK